MNPDRSLVYTGWPVALGTRSVKFGPVTVWNNGAILDPTTFVPVLPPEMANVVDVLVTDRNEIVVIRNDSGTRNPYLLKLKRYVRVAGTWEEV
jgi:hypothetical protein